MILKRQSLMPIEQAHRLLPFAMLPPCELPIVLGMWDQPTMVELIWCRTALNCLICDRVWLAEEDAVELAAECHCLLLFSGNSKSLRPTDDNADGSPWCVFQLFTYVSMLILKLLWKQNKNLI